MMKMFKDKAVSEILGAILLLFIVVVIMSLIYSFVWNELEPNEQTFVTVSGKVEGSNLVFEHYGGESIDADTHTSFTIAGEKHTYLIKEYLNDENNNNLWDYGERFVYNFTYDVFNLLAYEDIDVLTVDEEANDIVLMGSMDLKPVSDIGVELFVNNSTPKNGENVTITIVVTCYGGDVNGSADVKIRYALPSGLIFIGYNADTGVYDNSTGFWNIDLLLQDEPVSIDIKAQVAVEEINSGTQFGVILDGSRSIDTSDWQLMRDGTADAIENADYFPDDGSVELTVVQFGIDLTSYNCKSSLEIGPVNVTNGNKNGIASQIRSIGQGDGYTPMAAGIYRTTDVLKSSSRFSPDVRKVILLISDGLPNCKVDEGDYYGYSCGTSNNDYADGKSDTEDARDYCLNFLGMNIDMDEFNCFAVGTVGSGLDIEWLNESIAWPEPGYIGPPFDQGAGWVTHVETWNEFSERLETVFRSLFSDINSNVELYDSFTTDIISSNDSDVIVITPED